MNYNKIAKEFLMAFL